MTEYKITEKDWESVRVGFFHRHCHIFGKQPTEIHYDDRNYAFQYLTRVFLLGAVFGIVLFTAGVLTMGFVHLPMAFLLLVPAAGYRIYLQEGMKVGDITMGMAAIMAYYAKAGLIGAAIIHASLGVCLILLSLV